METTIYYFSSTGNSLDVANVISKELECDLLTMIENIGCQCDSQNIGFIFPTYFWGLPHIVEEFIKELVIIKDNVYIFGIMLAKAAGGGLGSLNIALEEKGFKLNYGKSIQSVSNYIVAYDIEEKTIPILVESAKEQALQYTQDIKAKKTNHCRKIPLLTDLFHNVYLKKIGDGDKNFSITQECINCGLCENICPVKNIKIINGNPVFQHHCEHCLACVHWCPKKAIGYGSKTEKHYHYHNPNISIKTLNK